MEQFLYVVNRYADVMEEAIHLFGVSAFPVVISLLPTTAVLISRRGEKEKCYEELS